MEALFQPIVAYKQTRVHPWRCESSQCRGGTGHYNRLSPTYRAGKAFRNTNLGINQCHTRQLSGGVASQWPCLAKSSTRYPETNTSSYYYTRPTPDFSSHLYFGVAQAEAWKTPLPAIVRRLGMTMFRGRGKSQ